MKKIFIISVMIFAIIGLSALRVPKLYSRVNDYANILTKSQEDELIEQLYFTEQDNTVQIVLLTIPSLRGDNLEHFSQKVVKKWEIGQENSDNGILVLVAMKERKIRIEVGYGLESIITDAAAGYLIRKDFVPAFKKGEYFKGIKTGLSHITGLITKEYTISESDLRQTQQRSRRKNKGSEGAFSILFFLIAIGASMLRRGIYGRRRFGGMTYFPGVFGGSSRGSGFGGFSGGGGGFGGGGASGGW